MSVKKYVLSVLAATLCSGPVLANVVTNVPIGKRGANKLPYRLSLPDDYAANKVTYPLLIYLHGLRARGTNLKIAAGPGGGYWNEKFILIAPQCPTKWYWWDDPPIHAVKKIVDREKKRLRIDGDRVYVTGYSLGGYGTYNMVRLYPKLCAAAAPVFGAGHHIKGPELKHIPFWGFHGARDPRVKLSSHQATVDTLRAAGTYVRFTVFPKMGHGPFSPSFNPTLFDWLLAQKRGTPHNFELGVKDGKSTRVLGFFEPKTVRKVTARAPNRAKGEVFAGWTSAAGTVVRDTTTQPSKSKGRFANAKALTTRFKMPANDVVVTANYRINRR